MAKVRHIAIRTGDVEQTAAFYRNAFGLQQIGAAQNGVYLTDGYLNIAILKMRQPMAGETMRLGLDHLGFHVDDLNAALAQIEALGGSALAGDGRAPSGGETGGESYFEVKCVGPDGQVFDVSADGWAGAR